MADETDLRIKVLTGLSTVFCCLFFQKANSGATKIKTIIAQYLEDMINEIS
jgi:hypothetical protein